MIAPGIHQLVIGHRLIALCDDIALTVGNVLIMDLIEDILMRDGGVAGLPHFSDISIDDLHDVLKHTFFVCRGNRVIVDAGVIGGVQKAAAFGYLIPIDLRIQVSERHRADKIERIDEIVKGSARLGGAIVRVCRVAQIQRIDGLLDALIDVFDHFQIVIVMVIQLFDLVADVIDIDIVLAEHRKIGVEDLIQHLSGKARALCI